MKALLITVFLGLIFALLNKHIPMGDHARNAPFLAGAVLYTVGMVWILVSD